VHFPNSPSYADPGFRRSWIEEVLLRKDLYPSKREAFLKKLPIFREKYHVKDFL
jgi:hypothetical protein